MLEHLKRTDGIIRAATNADATKPSAIELVTQQPGRPSTARRVPLATNTVPGKIDHWRFYFVPNRRETISTCMTAAVVPRDAKPNCGGANVVSVRAPRNAETALDLADAGLLASAESNAIQSIAGQPFDRMINDPLSDIPNTTLEEASF